MNILISQCRQRQSNQMNRLSMNVTNLLNDLINSISGVLVYFELKSINIIWKRVMDKYNRRSSIIVLDKISRIFF